MEKIENKMVVDYLWENLEVTLPDTREKSDNQGYKEIGTGIFVLEEDAYQYALERISLDESLQEEFVEWFYSKNWIKED